MSGRVLVVTNDYPPRRGGIESFVFSLCAALPPDDVVVYTARMAGSAAVDASVPYPVLRDRRRTLLPTPRVARAVRAVMGEHHCDRVVFGAAAPLGLLATGARSAGARTIVAVTHGHEVWWAKTPGARALLRRIGRRADVLTYVSEYCRREIAPALRPADARAMVRLAPSVDPELFRPGLDGSPVRRRLGLADHQPVVLSAARLVRRKGHDVLLAAWPTVLAAHQDAVLLVVGDGPSAGRLARAVRRRGLERSVRFLHDVAWADMAQMYAAAQVFALPCRTRLGGLEPEALGIVFLEAAACGLPIVVGRSGGAPETVHDAVTGYVVDPRDAADVARRIDALLSDPASAAAMGARGAAHVRSVASPHTNVAMLRRLLAAGEQDSAR